MALGRINKARQFPALPSPSELLYAAVPNIPIHNSVEQRARSCRRQSMGYLPKILMTGLAEGVLSMTFPPLRGENPVSKHTRMDKVRSIKKTSINACRRTSKVAAGLRQAGLTSAHSDPLRRRRI